MIRLLRTTAFVLLALALLPSCKASEEQAEAPPLEDVTVRVQNNNVLDMTVYAVRGAQRFRLGLVTTGRTDTFVLPGYLLTGSTHLGFVVDPVGSDRSYLVEEFSVFPGDEIDLVIPSYIAR